MAEVRLIREGWWRWIERGVRFDVSCTSTYVEDGNHRIVVDVGNAGEEEAYLAALKDAGVDPLKVDVVVLTHFHPDHNGLLHLFPNAEYVAAGTRWKGSIHAHWHDEALPITDDVYVLKVAGHSDADCAVVANTARGVVAMAGDLWVRSPSDPRLKVVRDKDALESSRRRLMGLAAWIVPGHGPMGAASEAVAELPETP
ncbi:MAG TPA: MBL fold metallo-hydrolase [Patescibacteria group bacterium]|nr:MBL fold metallo-hydrolase [Patescibacteria group bacterium]